MENGKSFVSLLVATPVFSYRITLKILVTLLFFIICITLLDQTGLLLDQLASNPDVSKMFVTVGSYSWYYDKKVSKKEKETNNEEKGKDEIFWAVKTLLIHISSLDDILLQVIKQMLKY